MSESRGGWELTKENIQPLSSGRRMAYLAESLPVRSAGGLTDQQEYEAHHMEEIRKLERIAEKEQEVASGDPLRLWVDIVKYFEQHFPNMSPTVHNKYEQLVKKSVQTFYKDDRYKNDKRYIELITKSASTAPPSHQIRVLRSLLDSGTGKLVSEMYVRLADIYKKEGDTKKASEMLHEGIKNNAEPQQLLSEMLTHVEQSWAEAFAKKLKEGETGAQQNDGDRYFASSVPIHGENNEAITIRQHLQPAAPTGSYRPKMNNNGKRHADDVFHEEEHASYHSHRSTSSTNAFENVDPRNFQDLGGTVGDKENRQKATKWDGGNANLNNPAIPEPPKLQLYVEPEVSQVASVSIAKKPLPVDKRVLKEKKVAFFPEPELQARPNGYQSEDVQKIAKSNVAEVYQPKPGLPTRFRLVSAKPRRICIPKTGKDFFEDIKYKPLPPGAVVDYIALKENSCLERCEKRRKEQMAVSEKNKVYELQKRIEELQSESSKHSQLSVKFRDQLGLAEVELKQKDKKIRSLEKENEKLTQQLTDLSTKSNVLESKYHRETTYLENQLQEQVEFRKRLELELQNCNTERARLLQEKLDQENEHQRMKDNESSEYEGIVHEKNSSAVDRRPITIDVRNRSSDKYSASSSTEQISSEISRFNSGETTCAAANSFMPNEYDGSIIGNENKISESLQERRALVDRPLETDMMNDTPATAPPMDFEIPPPTFACGSNLFRKPASLALYESYSHDGSLRRGTSRGISFTAGVRKLGAVGDQENAPCPVPKMQGPIILYSDENAAPPTQESRNTESPFLPDNQKAETSSSGIYQESNHQENIVGQKFVMPDLPYKKLTSDSVDTGMKMHSSDVSERLALLSSRPLNDYLSDEDEDDDMILRRHQQTGMDLNISNLTTALSLGPRPLINSTPERERTLRNLRGLAPSEVRGVIPPQEFEETAGQDYHGGVNYNSRVSRYNSVLNDPPLNLSIIQETSRENQSRSRSTTGSSSGNTMSATRFGMTGTSSTTPYFGNMTRSASIPRSANRAPQPQCNNNNGYYSDNNLK